MHFDLIIDKLVPGGDGLARHEGKVVFVPGTLPGEKVRVRPVESRKDFMRAELAEILEPSPARIDPPCPVAGRCGGCDWQHIDYAEQLRQKLALVADALRRTGGIAWPGLGIEAGKPLRYRNRIQLHRAPSGETGFLARGSHAVVPVSSCPVAHPALDALLSSGTAQASPGSPAGRFPAWAHTSPGGETELRAGGPGNREGGETPVITVEILGRPISFDLGCFFQSNVAMLEKLIPFALAGPGGASAMDLYGGVGVFGAFLADRFDAVLSVEENPAALAYARRNIAPGGPASRVFLEGRLEDLLARRHPALLEARPDLVLVDPPRTGLDASVREFLGESRPPRLVYVSCHPVTLARDLQSLLQKGFLLEDLRLFDFYPQTAHVEAVARLTCGSA